MSYADKLLEVKAKNKKYTDEMISKLEDISFIRFEKKIISRSQIIEFEKKELQELKKVKKKIVDKYVAAGGCFRKSNNPKSRDWLYQDNKEFPSTLGRGKELDRELQWPDDTYKTTLDSDRLFDQLYGKIDEMENILSKEIKGRDKGEEGEERISEALNMYRNKYIIRENILLPAQSIGRDSSETDLYIITPKGVCVCEIKNYGKKGETLKISRDGMWSVVKSGRRESVKKDSPVEQNASHCLATEQWLEENGLPGIKMIPIIFIANNEVKVENDSPNAIMRVSELYNYINALNLPEVISKEKQQHIADVLEKGNEKVTERKFEALSFSGCKQQISNYIDDLLSLKQDEYNWKKAVYDKVSKKNNKIDKGTNRAAMILKLVVALYGISLAIIEWNLIPIFGDIVDFLVIGVGGVALYIWLFRWIMVIGNALTETNKHDASTKYIIYGMAVILLIIWIAAFNFVRNRI